MRTFDEPVLVDRIKADFQLQSMATRKAVRVASKGQLVFIEAVRRLLGSGI